MKVFIGTKRFFFHVVFYKGMHTGHPQIFYRKVFLLLFLISTTTFVKYFSTRDQFQEIFSIFRDSYFSEHLAIVAYMSSFLPETEAEAVFWRSSVK